MFQAQTRALKVDHLDALEQISQDIKAKDTEFRNRWFRLNESVKDRQASFLETCPFSDLKAYDIILPKIPRGAIIQCANSAPVRYVQLFTNRADIDYYSNRGVSGIDGCTSTAMGMASQTKRPVVLLSGDMAFRYDNNAFWIPESPEGLKCIVLNNAGGGIFRIIPGPGESGHLETAFEAHMENRAEKVALMYDVPYIAAHDEESLSRGMEELFLDDRTMILEVFTPREENARILEEYFQAIREN
jgi:2-succinyl-5-enolpyruvyl-6-hydroxy-3-cyclohexene-1-carboxylate synthase